MLLRAFFALPLWGVSLAAQAVPLVGEAAPNFTLTDAAGRGGKLSDKWAA